MSFISDIRKEYLLIYTTIFINLKKSYNITLINYEYDIHYGYRYFI